MAPASFLETTFKPEFNASLTLSRPIRADIRFSGFEHGNLGTFLGDDEIGHILVSGNSIPPMFVSRLKLDKRADDLGMPPVRTATDRAFRESDPSLPSRNSPWA